MDKGYRVVFEKNAIKQLSKIDKSQKVMLYSYIEKTLQGTENPRMLGSSLKGTLKSYWRYRIGDYRIIADINDSEIVIIVIEVGHRKEI